MEIVVKNHKSEIDELLSDKIIELLKHDVLVTLASGDTFVETYKMVAKKYNRNPFEIKATLVNLDEWVGLDKEDVGGCQYNMFKDLFTPIGISEFNLIYFDAKANDLDKECARIEKCIGNRTFDYVLLGVGMNGHLALNEPGCMLDTKVFHCELADTTRVVLQKYFPSKVSITKGISLGIEYFRKSKELVIVANGVRKHDIIQRTIHSEVTNEIPATIVKEHQNSCLILDKECIEG